MDNPVPGIHHKPLFHINKIMIISLLIGSVAGFIGGVLFGRRNVRLVEEALLDAKVIANEIKEEAEMKTKKLKEELEQALKEKKTPKKKKEQA